MARLDLSNLSESSGSIVHSGDMMSLGVAVGFMGFSQDQELAQISMARGVDRVEDPSHMLRVPSSWGGGGVGVASIMEAVAAQGNEVDVITSRFSHVPSMDKMNGVTVHRVNALRSESYPGFLKSSQRTTSTLSLAAFVPSSIAEALRLASSRKDHLCEVKKSNAPIFPNEKQVPFST